MVSLYMIYHLKKLLRMMLNYENVDVKRNFYMNRNLGCYKLFIMQRDINETIIIIRII
jgi:hypothetical protein